MRGVYIQSSAKNFLPANLGFALELKLILVLTIDID